MDYKQYGVMGKDILDIQFIKEDEVLISYNDGRLIKVNFPVNKSKPKLEMSRFLRSVYPGLTDSEILAKQGTEWKAIARNEKEIEKIDELYAQYEEEIALDNAGKVNPKVVGAIAGIGAVVAIGAIVGLKIINKDKTTDDTQLNNTTAIESTIETTEETDKLSLENVSYATLIEALQTGKLNGVELNETQRQLLLDTFNFINDNAQKEEWEKVTLTDEELEAVNARLADLGYPVMDGNTAQFGYTYNQVLETVIRLNRNLTNEDIAKLTGGELLDVTRIMDRDGTSNAFIRAEVERYLFGGFRNENGLDASHYDVTKILGFGEHEISTYNELVGLINEYSSLQKDGNKEEAEAKMVEIESHLMKILTSPSIDGNYKEYIGETVYVAASIESQVNGYRTEMTVTVIDSRTGRETEITREAPLFNEYQAATVISGLDTFDKEAFMAKYNIDANRYEMVISSVEGSIVNAVCGGQRERLEAYNEWIKFRSETELASYRENTLVLKDVIAIMDEGLKAKYPMNLQYYNSFSSLYIGNDLENTNGNTNTMPDVPALPGNTATSSITPITVPEGENPLGLDPTNNAQLQAQAAANAGAVTTAQANAYNAALQEIYNAAYNYYLGQNVRPTSVTFDPAWLQSNDPYIVSTVTTAHAQADAEKYTHDGAYSGGGTSATNNGLGTISDTTAPTAGPAPAATQEVITNPNQSDIDQQMANVEASTNGNGAGNGTTQVPGDQTTTETQAITAQDVNNQPGGPQTNPNANSTNNKPNEDETFNDYDAALAALNAGFADSGIEVSIDKSR